MCFARCCFCCSASGLGHCTVAGRITNTLLVLVVSVQSPDAEQLLQQLCELCDSLPGSPSSGSGTSTTPPPAETATATESPAEGEGLLQHLLRAASQTATRSADLETELPKLLKAYLSAKYRIVELPGGQILVPFGAENGEPAVNVLCFAQHQVCYAVVVQPSE